MENVRLTNISLYVFVIAMSLVLISSSFISNVYAQSENSNSTKIQHIFKTGKNSYYVKFKTCIGDEYIQNPIFVIKSDQGIKIEKYKKIINPNNCKTFETQVKAKYSNLIEIKLIKE